ncbi:MAG: RNA-guided pseudouridylation complex pseudouridine synthase subunit Cbf5 [Nitrososphaerales archaeon]
MYKPKENHYQDLSKYTAEEARKNENDLVVLKEESANPKYGWIPSQRPIKKYLRYGFIALDKPQGPTSHEVVAWVRKMLDQERAGHSGTLDPLVSGVLPIGLGEGTKALSALLLGPKEYIAVARIHDSVPKNILYGALSEFVGPIFQRPPQRSSVKRVTRIRTIYEHELLEELGNILLLRVLCEAGTYIRKLIYDVGEIIIVGATMAELRRTRVCHILESDLVRLHDLNEANEVFKESGDDSKLRKIVRPIEESILFLKQLRIRDSAVESLCQGAQLAIPGVLSFSKGMTKGEIVRIMTQKGELVAFGESQMDESELSSSEHGLAALTKRVIMEPGTYPKMWKAKKEEVGTSEITEELLKKSILDALEKEDKEQSG